MKRKKLGKFLLGAGVAALLLPLLATNCFAAGESAALRSLSSSHLLDVIIMLAIAVFFTIMLIVSRRRYNAHVRALQSAHESFSALVHENPNVALMFDDELNFIDCNQAFMNMLGFKTKEEALASFYTIVPQLIEPIQKGGRQSVPITERLKDALQFGEAHSESALIVNGKELYLDISYKRIPYEDSYAVVCYANDITALREEEEKLSSYAKTIGLSGAYFWEIDVKTRQFRLIADNYDWLGIKDDFSLGDFDLVASAITFGEDMHYVDSVLNPFLEGSGEGTFSFILRLRNFVSGGLVWVRVLGYADAWDSEGKVSRVTGSFLNLDDQMRKIAEHSAELETRRLLFDNLFKVLDPAILFMPDGTMFANEAFSRVFTGWRDIYQDGVGIDDAVKAFWRRIIINTDEALAQAARLRETFSEQEGIWHFRDGTELHFRSNIVEVSPGQYVELWVSRDITELSKTKLMFNEIFNVMDPAVAVLSDGSMVANDAYSLVFPNWEDIYNNALTGDDEHDFNILSEYWNSMITNADEHITAISKIRGTHEDVECIWHFRDGKECIQKGYWLDAGKVSGELWVLTDVTELYDAMRRANDASMAKSMFLSSMSHEIRTPMNAIIGLTSLARKTHDTVKSQRYLEKIEEAGHRLMSLINDVLDMSKIESGKMQISENEFDYMKTCEHAVNAIADKASEKHISLKIVYNAKFPRLIWADELRISQVLINLLSNAVKFTGEGGTVIVTTDIVEDRLIRVSCADNGIGISDEGLSKLFNEFEQADKSITRQFGGTGLGLAICKKIVELMGGSIYVSSVLGEGSVFTFEVPFEWRGPIVAASSVAEALENTRVLVVDDEPSITEYFVEVLREYYISVDTAADGLEALEKTEEAMESGRPYRIAFIDWKMPGISGSETALRMHALCPQCKMIIISGFDWTDIRETFDASVLRGEIDFMPKPIPPSDIYNRIIKTLNIDINVDNVLNFQGKRILLVEDVEVNRLIVTAILEDTDCIIDEAENGEIGVEMARKTKYDLILMDMQMPVMDGLTATREIRLFNTEVPIIAMTANAFKEDADSCLDAGMNAHIAKPIDNESFMRILSDYLVGTQKPKAKRAQRKLPAAVGEQPSEQSNQ
ncbi:MAG: response regulator [Oscillospiraceae bacterium]|jgi:PAS domain S-box-containing protein|nr:response regulator [Oscillospiraceae bacterium]